VSLGEIRVIKNWMLYADLLQKPTGLVTRNVRIRIAFVTEYLVSFNESN
jgi:hypothetical protein